MKDHQSPNGSALPRELEDWLGQLDTENQNELEKTWRYAALAQVDAPTKEEVARAVNTFDRALEKERVRGPRAFASDRAASRKPYKTVRKWSVALPVCVLLAVGGWLYFAPVVVDAPAGGLASITLPDGSTVLLNSSSRITYRRWLLGAARNVSLAGEAFFDVSPGEKPFIVETRNAEVRVLGTQFNVRSWAGGSEIETEVMLEEGSVSFNAKHDPASAVRLRPGQMSRVSGTVSQPAQPFPFVESMELVWREGGISFLDKPISTILQGIEKKFDVSIQGKSFLPQDDTLTFFIPTAQNAAQVLMDFCGHVGCEVEKIAGGFRIIETE